MTPHDLELKRYNEIADRLDQIEAVLFKAMDNACLDPNRKFIYDSVTLSLVYLRDVKDMFRRYAERQHDTSGD